MVDEDGVVTVVKAEEVEDKDGNVIKVVTDVAETELLEGGVIHKHETETTEKDGQRVVIDREEFRDAEGVIAAHTEIMQVEADG